MDDSGYNGYCNECYGEIWDAGFESTSEHAYEVGFHDLVDKLDQECNKKMKCALGEIIAEWGPLEWKCGKCEKAIITKAESSKLKMAEKIEKLCGACQHCGIKGHVEPTSPDKFFH